MHKLATAAAVAVALAAPTAAGASTTTGPTASRPVASASRSVASAAAPRTRVLKVRRNSTTVTVTITETCAFSGVYRSGNYCSLSPFAEATIAYQETARALAVSRDAHMVHTAVLINYGFQTVLGVVGIPWSIRTALTGPIAPYARRGTSSVSTTTAATAAAKKRFRVITGTRWVRLAPKTYHLR